MVAEGHGGDDPASIPPRSPAAISAASSGSRCRAGDATRARRPSAPHRRRARQQSAEPHRRHPARPVRRRHRRVGLGQVHAGHRHPVSGAGPPLLPRQGDPRARTPGSRGWTRSTRSSTSTRARSAGRRGRIPPRTPGCSRPIRELFTQLPDAKMRGYGPGRFSFNVKGGRCEACQGDGLVKIEMHFLPDVYVPCEVCKGRRYNRETLEVRYKGRSIADVLDLTVADALEFFSNQRRIAEKLELLNDVGPGLHPPGPGGDHALRRRGPAGQARHRAGQAGHRPHALHPRRADHRPPLRGRAAAARGAAPPGGQGEQRGRDRAQPRRDQDGGLDHRPGARGRRGRRDRWWRRGRRRTWRRRERSHTGRFLRRALAAPSLRSG